MPLYFPSWAALFLSTLFIANSKTRLFALLSLACYYCYRTSPFDKVNFDCLHLASPFSMCIHTCTASQHTRPRTTPSAARSWLLWCTRRHRNCSTASTRLPTSKTRWHTAHISRAWKAVRKTLSHSKAQACSELFTMQYVLLLFLLW